MGTGRKPGRIVRGGRLVPQNCGRAETYCGREIPHCCEVGGNAGGSLTSALDVIACFSAVVLVGAGNDNPDTATQDVAAALMRLDISCFKIVEFGNPDIFAATFARKGKKQIHSKEQGEERRTEYSS